MLQVARVQGECVRLKLGLCRLQTIISYDMLPSWTIQTALIKFPNSVRSCALGSCDTRRPSLLTLVDFIMCDNACQTGYKKWTNIRWAEKWQAIHTEEPRKTEGRHPCRPGSYCRSLLLERRRLRNLAAKYWPASRNRIYYLGSLLRCHFCIFSLA